MRKATAASKARPPLRCSAGHQAASFTSVALQAIGVEPECALSQDAIPILGPLSAAAAKQLKFQPPRVRGSIVYETMALP